MRSRLTPSFLPLQTKGGGAVAVAGDESKKGFFVVARPSKKLVIACLLSFVVGYSSRPHQKASPSPVVLSADDPCSDRIPRGVPPFKVRGELGGILEREKKTVGAELGVRTGGFAALMLSRWPSNEEYLLVDLWAHQENYADLANFDQAKQDENYQATMNNTAKWEKKRRVCRNYTSVCVEDVPDGHFDFIYVDARHDFKGVYEDITAWWPKLRADGIMAGHDYVTQDDGPAQTKQDWTINYDGTKDETGTVVKGAVDKFAAEVCRQLTIAYRETKWNTWALRK